MKYKNKSILVLYLISVALLIAACSQAQESQFKPVRVNLSGDFFGIVSPPRNGTLRNFTILTNDTEKKIVLFAHEISQNRIIVLPKGQYEFRADGVQSRVFDLLDDCKIASDGRIFTQNLLVEPPSVISFLRGTDWNVQSPLTENLQYQLTILDIDRLNEPVASYNMTISGIGDIPLKPNKENNRIISEELRFTRGTYTANVSVNGVTTKIPPLTFRVIPLPPFSLTINNTWEGKPLQYADIIAYKVARNTSLRSVIPRRDDGSGSASFNSFDYTNDGAVIRVNGQRFLNTRDNGRLVLPGINDGDRIILIAMGINADDDVYTYTIPNANRGSSTITVPWQEIPSKGRDFVINVPIDRNSLDSWGLINNFSVSFFYRPGNPATITSQTVLSGNGFTRINGVSVRRETDDSIMCFVDLSRLSKVSNFNYLLRVEDEDIGVFIMNNTSDEMSAGSQPLRRQGAPR